MRGNSGFLRLNILIGLITFLAVSSLIECGPVRSRRMIRDIYTGPEHQTYLNSNETHTIDTCNYNGKEIERSSVTCDQKPGCQAIQTHGACCPEYQCDCKRDGKVYENGAKIVDPETPCRVCVCRGGELNCNLITCYNRNDCKPKFIVGRCCPEYDNCPPLENVKFSFSKEHESEEKFSLKSTMSPKLEDAPLTSNSPLTIHHVDNPLGIKIKEITKTGEIRITDDRPKSTYKPTKISDSSKSTTERDYYYSSSTTSPLWVVGGGSGGGGISSTISSIMDGSIESSGDDNETIQNEEIDDKLEPTHDENLEEHDAFIGDYGKGDDLTSSGKNIRQVDNSTNDRHKTNSATSESVENVSESDELNRISSSTMSPSEAIDVDNDTNDDGNNDKKKEDPVVFVVDHKGQTQSIVIHNGSGLQKVDEPIEQHNTKDHRPFSILSPELISVTIGPSTESSNAPDLLKESASTASPFDGKIFDTIHYPGIGEESAQNDLPHSTKGPQSAEFIDSSSKSPLSDEASSSSTSVEYSSLDTESSSSSSEINTTTSEMPIFETHYYPLQDSHEGSASNKQTSAGDVSRPLENVSESSNSNDDDLEIKDENPAYPQQPDDLTPYATIPNDETDHHVIVRPSERNDHLMDKVDTKILLDVLPLRVNHTIEMKNSIDTTVAPTEWLKANGNESSTNTETLSSAESVNSNSGTTQGPHELEKRQNRNVDNEHQLSSNVDELEIIASNENGDQIFFDMSSTSSGTAISSTTEYESIDPVDNANVDDSSPKRYKNLEENGNYFTESFKDFLRFQNKFFTS